MSASAAQGGHKNPRCSEETDDDVEKNCKHCKPQNTLHRTQHKQLCITNDNNTSDSCFRSAPASTSQCERPLSRWKSRLPFLSPNQQCRSTEETQNTEVNRRKSPVDVILSSSSP